MEISERELTIYDIQLRNKTTYTSLQEEAALVPNFYWRDYIPGDIPCEAYEGAPGRYIGQVLSEYQGNKHLAPATIYLHSNTAVSEIGGKQVHKDYFKILCSPDNSRFYWEYIDLNKPHELQMKEAVRGGFDGNVYIFIGKVQHEEEWKIGKIVFDYDSKGFWVWDKEGKSIKLQQTSILKYNLTESCQSQCSIYSV